MPANSNTASSRKNLFAKELGFGLRIPHADFNFIFTETRPLDDARLCEDLKQVQEEETDTSWIISKRKGRPVWRSGGSKMLG
jgi:hypothetical protein